MTLEYILLVCAIGGGILVGLIKFSDKFVNSEPKFGGRLEKYLESGYGYHWLAKNKTPNRSDFFWADFDPTRNEHSPLSQ